MMTTDKNRSVPIDMLKSLAIISVLLIHSGVVMGRFGSPYYIDQAVPIFIIIAAYNGVNSYVRANATTLVQCYYNIPRRFNRVILPYFAVLIIEYLRILVANLLMGKNYSYPDVFLFILTGGYGPGGFFIPVLLSLILILPILYLLYRKNLLLMLAVAFIVNITFEVYALKSGMPNQIYRLMFFRYLFAIGLGIWLAFGIDRRWLAVGGVISFIYITAVDYFDYIPLGNPSWYSQNILSFVWPLVLVVIGLYVAPKRINNIYVWFISEIGKASYHIFLTQMVYFWVLGGYISKLSASFFIINIIICVSIGLIFNYTSQIVASKIKTLRHKSDQISEQYV
jgi:hypothetical protein